MALQKWPSQWQQRSTRHRREQQKVHLATDPAKQRTDLSDETAASVATINSNEQINIPDPNEFRQGRVKASDELRSEAEELTYLTFDEISMNELYYNEIY